MGQRVHDIASEIATTCATQGVAKLFSYVLLLRRHRSNMETCSAGGVTFFIAILVINHLPLGTILDFSNHYHQCTYFAVIVSVSLTALNQSAVSCVHIIINKAADTNKQIIQV